MRPVLHAQNIRPVQHQHFDGTQKVRVLGRLLVFCQFGGQRDRRRHDNIGIVEIRKELDAAAGQLDAEPATRKLEDSAKRLVASAIGDATTISES